MALAITAPVPVAHSGESDPAQFAEALVGEALPDIVGTTDTSGGNVKIEVSGPQVDAAITFAATLFAFSTAGKLMVVPQAPGMYSVKVTDVTSGNEVDSQIEVFES
jgi:sarcosine oxidase gamma subunit